MKFFSFPKIRQALIIVIVMIVCASITYFITGITLFPDRIEMSAGNAKIIDTHMPFGGVIESETVETFKINDKPIKAQNTLDFKKENKFSANDIGHANMLLTAFGIPIKDVDIDVVPSTKVVPCGMTVGVNINSNGVVVINTGEIECIDGKSYMPCDGLLKPGDVILNVADKKLRDSEEFSKIIKNSPEGICLKVKRNNDILNEVITPVKNVNDDTLMIGALVKDSTQGIGTMTYYNPETKKFGALGHGIVNGQTKELMEVTYGEIYDSYVKDVRKGEVGSPGELLGALKSYTPLGEIEKNCRFGLYGNLEDDSIAFLPSEEMEVGLQDEVCVGPAKIYSNVKGDSTEAYDVYIEAVNRFSDENSKGMVIKITDEDLLNTTNGIVQGMSGSPIIQNGKLIGAVTHVFVKDPTKGYGVFIENMLESEI